MIRYKSQIITVPAGGEKLEPILNVKAGEKVVIHSFGRSNIDGLNAIIEIEGDRIVDADSNLSVNMGNFIPVEIQVEGPKAVKAGGRDIWAGGGDMVVAIAYEEMKE